MEEGRGENSPKPDSRFETLNRSSRRQSALTSAPLEVERTDVRCYEVDGEEEPSTVQDSPLLVPRGESKKAAEF